MKKTLSKNILKSVALICLIVIFASIAGHALAAVDSVYAPLAPLPDLNAKDLKLAESISFDTYVTYLFNLLIALGAVAAVLMITWGGFEYMTSDAVNDKKDGIAKIKNAIYGLLLVLSSVLILRTINPQFIVVPPGLVPAANLAQPTDGLANWNASLQKQLNDYNIQSAEIAKNMREAYEKNIELDAATRSIEDQIKSYSGNDASYACAELDYSGDSDPQLSEMCSSWLTARDTQAKFVSDSKATIAQKTISTYSGEALKTPGSVNQKEIDNLANLYQSAVKDATSNGTSPDKFEPVKNAYYLADTQMRQAYMTNNDYFQNKTTQLDTIINTDIPRITDPAMRQQAIDSVSTQVQSFIDASKKDSGNVNPVLLGYQTKLKSLSAK